MLFVGSKGKKLDKKSKQQSAEGGKKSLLSKAPSTSTKPKEKQTGLKGAGEGGVGVKKTGKNNNGAKLSRF